MDTSSASPINREALEKAAVNLRTKHGENSVAVLGLAYLTSKAALNRDDLALKVCLKLTDSIGCSVSDLVDALGEVLEGLPPEEGLPILTRITDFTMKGPKS